MTNRKEESTIRRKIEQRLSVGAPIEEYIQQCIRSGPNNFVRMIFQQPIENEEFWNIILNEITDIERYVEPRKLYLFLADQLLVDKRRLLQIAIEHHEEELWLLQISRVIEGENFGYAHVTEKNKSKYLPHWVFRYAFQGARQGLVKMAEETGNPIPAAALLRVDAEKEGIAAAVGALKKKPRAPVLEYIAAANGPDVQGIAKELRKYFSDEDMPRCLQAYH